MIKVIRELPVCCSGSSMIQGSSYRPVTIVPASSRQQPTLPRMHSDFFPPLLSRASTWDSRQSAKPCTSVSVWPPTIPCFLIIRFTLSLVNLNQWCSWKLLGIKWYYHVWNNEVRWTTQLHLLAVAQTRRFSLFGHSTWMPDNRCQEDLSSLSSLENWRRPTRCPRTTWIRTIQQDLKYNNVSLNKAIDVAQNRPLWRLMSTFGITHSSWCMPEKRTEEP